ncbi:MAG: alpha/beta fold hydrolase [Hyphomicrobium sp.]|nr:alpha/beta fold hydrolase [Hyphomicrobium sp.]
MVLGTMHSNSHGPDFASFAAADEARRGWGRVLDFWMARRETPYRLVLERPGLRLRCYGRPGDQPSWLIIPAPIKKHYIWDLLPSVSVVQRCLESGFNVYLLEWTEAPRDDPNIGIATYADRHILDCANAIGRPIVLAGHSLGGTFAAIFSSLHPEKVGALVLLEAPLSFAEDTGAIARLIRQFPSVEALSGFDDCPGVLLGALGVAASPESFLWWRWRDGVASLVDPEALYTHLLVERWLLDELAMPGGLFADVVDLYQQDHFMRRTLRVGDKPAAARNVTAPVLAVIDPESDVVPPSSVMPFLDVLPGRDKKLLRYEGDTGIALRHVGVLVGRNAHRTLWPEVLAWVNSRSAH